MDIKSEMIDLVRAFNEARLAALHVDMQLKFHEHICRENRIPTKEVFPVVKKFAQDLRDCKVPNHWIAYTGYWNKLSYKEFSRGNLGEGRYQLTRDLRLMPNMGIDDNDLVFEKAKQWAFRNTNCVLTNHLNDSLVDTLIIDGVKDKHCIAGTISTGLKNGFRIYAAMDATNCPSNLVSEYKDWFLRPHDLTTEQKSKVTFTDTVSILSALQQAQNSEIPQPAFVNG